MFSASNQMWVPSSATVGLEREQSGRTSWYQTTRPDSVEDLEPVRAGVREVAGRHRDHRLAGGRGVGDGSYDESPPAASNRAGARRWRPSRRRCTPSTPSTMKAARASTRCRRGPRGSPASPASTGRRDEPIVGLEAVLDPGVDRAGERRVDQEGQLGVDGEGEGVGFRAGRRVGVGVGGRAGRARRCRRGRWDSGSSVR